MKGQEAFLLFKKGHLVFKKPDDLFPCNKIRDRFKFCVNVKN